MSQKFVIRATLLPGQPFYCRAGRGWTGNPTMVELLDQDDDPMLPNPNKNLPDVPDPVRIGRRSFEKLQKDSRISIKTDGDETAEALASKLPSVQLELGEAKARIAELEASADQAALHLKSVEADRDALKIKVAELETILSDATKPASEKKAKPPKA